MDDFIVNNISLDEQELMDSTSLPENVSLLLLKQYKSCKSKGYQIELVNDLSIWKLHLNRELFDTILYNDLVLFEIPFIEIEIVHTNDYPYIQPSYRVISPDLYVDIYSDTLMTADGFIHNLSKYMQPYQAFKLLSKCLSKCKLRITLPVEEVKRVEYVDHWEKVASDGWWRRGVDIACPEPSKKSCCYVKA